MATKVVLIYGPPAVGKLTVAKELQKLTGYSLFENHLVADLIAPIFGYGTKKGRDLNAKIRWLIYESAIKNGLPGLISPFSYYHDAASQLFVRESIHRIKKYGGIPSLVRLSCDMDELYRRVVHPSRKSTNKIKTAKKLKNLLEEKNLFAAVPISIAKSLHIDNTHLDPRKTAELIKEYFRLP